MDVEKVTKRKRSESEEYDSLAVIPSKRVQVADAISAPSAPKKAKRRRSKKKDKVKWESTKTFYLPPLPPPMRAPMRPRLPWHGGPPVYRPRPYRPHYTIPYQTPFRRPGYSRPWRSGGYSRLY